jgi:DNA-binding beta-propeller fold protein YncE
MLTDGKKLLERMLDALLPNRAAPCLAKVLKANTGAGKTKYSCDVRVLKAGTLEETDMDIAEVPLSPMWVNQKKRGVYAIPPKDAVVVVEFLEWNPAYPYIAGMWGDDYEADDFAADQFVISDGNGMKVVIDSAKGTITADSGKAQVFIDGDKIAVKNNGKSLFTVLSNVLDHSASLVENVANHQTVGPPTQHVVSPGDITKFNQDKSNFTQDKSDLSALMEA